MKNILVIGDVLLDQEIICVPDRVSSEAPLLIYKNKSYNETDSKFRLGGAGNVIANLVSLKHNVDVYWPQSNDPYSNTISNLFKKMKVTSYPINISNIHTTIKTRFFSAGKQIFRYDIQDKITNNENIKINNILKISDNKYDYAILSDYNSGFFNKEHTQKILKLLSLKNIKVIIDPHTDKWEIYSNCFLITPNFSEFCQVIGHKINNDSTTIVKHAITLIKKNNIKYILVTRSEKGMILIDKNGLVRSIHAKPTEVVDVTGAGDTVVATLVSKLNENISIADALPIANFAASIVIKKMGVATIKKADLLFSYLNIKNKIFYSSSKKHMNNLKSIATSSEIVFTNGTFDILHYGHLSYLHESASLNKKLIIGLNSDEIVKKIKGPNRPINNEISRALTLASLPFVFAIVIFNEFTAINLIKELKPHTYTKGDEYKTKKLPEKKYAQNIVFIDYKKDFSTSNIIEKVKKSYIEKNK